jgi:fibronectin type 3 domain-containing protein
MINKYYNIYNHEHYKQNLKLNKIFKTKKNIYITLKKTQLIK